MITGDHKVTASAIARRIGILQAEDIAVTGTELDAMSDGELREKLPHISVYARVSPDNKIRIVQAWQDLGHIVAMTGDGVNDAPALKSADVGVAMGITGTEVAKDSASMILTDDNFATIIKSVLNGRNIYANIKNAIKFLLSGKYRRDPGRAVRFPDGAAESVHRGATSVYQPDHRQPALRWQSAWSRPIRR